MKCFVAGCKNVSGNKSQGITFHALPKDPDLAKAWLQALGRETLLPKEKCFVCSDHFLTHDYYITKGGIRKVRRNAVPSIFQDASNNHTLPSLDDGNHCVKVCRICLAIDVKLVSIMEYKLELPYEEMTGISLDEDTLPKYLCVECAQRLINCSRFRRKSYRAYLIMMKLLKSYNIEQLTQKCLASINRNKHKLTSCLTTKIYNPDFYDYHYMECSETELTVNKEEIKLEDYVDNDEIDDGNSGDDVNNKNSQDMKISNNLPLEKQPLNLNFFKITHLSLDEQIEQMQLRKETTQYKNAYFKCTLCYKGFVTKQVYDVHMLKHSDKFGEYACPVCKIRFKRPGQRNIHARRFHAGRYSCTQCFYVVNSRYSAICHQRWHEGKIYKCPHCDKTFEFIKRYSNHVRIVHPSDFVCEMCGYTFVSETGKKQHKALSHIMDDNEIPEDGPLCELCNIRFASEKALKTHLQVSLKHNTTSMKKQNQRVVRTTRYKKTGPIPCEQCGLKIKNYIEYDKHFRSEHSGCIRTVYPAYKYKPTMCHLCGKVFRNPTLLKMHSHIHIGGKPFVCDLCSKGFTAKHSLIKHISIHSEIRKTYPCHVCGKHLSFRNNLRTHLRTHSDVRPFSCDVCDKSFKTLAALREHTNHIHLKVPWPKRDRRKRKEPQPQIEDIDDDLGVTTTVIDN